MIVLYMSILYALLTLFIIASAVPLMLSLRKGVGRINWVEFYSMGKDAGFSFREINLLRKAAVVNRHQKPSSLFWSVEVLDKSLAGIHKTMEAEKDPDEKEYLEFLLEKMYKYRKKIEFQKPRYKQGLESTWDIPINQVLKLKVEMVGVYECSVIENNKTYMLVTYPKGPPLPVGFSWREKNLNVYFWKKEDAGYFFQARIMEGYPDRDFKTLRMTQSDVVLRSQKRRSVRSSCRIPAQLYPLKSVKSSPPVPESVPGLRCLLKDLSEDGAALMIGGRGEKNMALKFQFPLFGKTAVMRGVVRTVDYDRGKNLSLLHIQAVEPDEESRYLILSFVYDIFRGEKKKGPAAEPVEEPAPPSAGESGEPKESEGAVEAAPGPVEEPEPAGDEALETLEAIEDELPDFQDENV